MRILLFLYISFEQFNIEKFKMRPQRTFQNSTFINQNSHCHPFRSSNLVPRLAVVGVALPLSFADRSSRKTKYFIDYDYELPPVESNHRKGHAGRGIG